MTNNQIQARERTLIICRCIKSFRGSNSGVRGGRMPEEVAENFFSIVSGLKEGSGEEGSGEKASLLNLMASE